MIPNYTKDIDDHFFAVLRDVGSEVLCDPLHLLKVLKSESDVRANAWNDNPKSLPPEKRYNASGINQMMPATLVGLGWKTGHSTYRQLTATQQLDWVERYLRPYRGKLGSVGALYTANFLPALVGFAGDPNFVLTAKNGVLGWAYGPNAVFDTNGDLKITVGELEAAVERNCTGPRWAELLERLTGERVSEELTGTDDLGTVQGFQAALDRLGYNVGKLDGLAGPKTRDALVQFQAQRGLKADGIYGPKTRQALEIALATRM